MSSRSGEWCRQWLWLRCEDANNANLSRLLNHVNAESTRNGIDASDSKQHSALDNSTIGSRATAARHSVLTGGLHIPEPNPSVLWNKLCALDGFSGSSARAVI